MNLSRLLILLLGASCAACAVAPTQAAGSRTKSAHIHHRSQRRAARAAVTGEWGSPRAVLTLTAKGGRIEYDCAQGSLDAPVVPDANGAFQVAGQHFQGHGGPVRSEEEQPVAQPATFRGTVSGDRMHLDVSSASEHIGSFDLQRGATDQLHHCL